MDAALCDELLHEIFLRLPPPCSAVSLVSKRWLRLHRSSKTHLSLRLSSDTRASLSSFLSHFPLLSSLSLSSSTSSSGDSLLLSAAASCPSLRHLRLLSCPVSNFALVSLSAACPHLLSLSISLVRPFSLQFLSLFRSLNDLSLYFSPNSILLFDSSLGNPDFNPTQSDSTIKTPNFTPTLFNSSFVGPNHDSTQFNSSPKSPSFNLSLKNPNIDSTQLNCSPKGSTFGSELKLETLTLSCIQNDDYGLDWLYRSCKKLKKLQFRGCEGIGDNPSSSSFSDCIRNIQEVELRTCRMIVDDVLLKLADNCKLLKSLLVYDGGCREGLLRFIERSECDLQKLDLRLPLDLDNSHLLAAATKFRGLTTLRLQSCCLVTGEGLKAICSSLRDGLEELALINCDVAEREQGLLTTLGQNLKGLKKLDLSYNEMLVDKEFASMIVSCAELRELKLRGCRGLSNLTLVSVSKCCKNLECVDIIYCCGIDAKGVELFVSNSPRLKQLKVEESKLLDQVKIWGSKLIC